MEESEDGEGEDEEDQTEKLWRSGPQLLLCSRVLVAIGCRLN